MAFRNNLQTRILTFFALETFSVTYLLKLPFGGPLAAVLYVVSGIGIVMVLLSCPELRLPEMKFSGLRPSGPPALKHPPGSLAGRPVRTIHYRMVAIGLLALMIFDLSRLWFDELPMDVNYADMLPIIKAMGERFAAGHGGQVYDKIPWIWKGVQPIYLPAMWLPYVPAVVLGIDIRWVTVTALWVTFSIFILLFRPARGRYLDLLTALLAFLLFWWIFGDNTAGIITATEEGVVIAYYALLVLALLSGNAFLTGVAASLCMLSRYALAGWIPAYFLYLLLNRRYRQAVIFSLTGLGCFVLLFLLPVGWPTFVRLAGLPGEYIDFARRVWKDSPGVFSSAPGLAWWFGREQGRLLHGLLLACSFLVPVGGLIFCQLWKRRGRSMANIPLAILKLSLVVFYSMIDVPYLYLFYTGSIVSLLAVTLVLQTEGADGSNTGAEKS